MINYILMLFITRSVVSYYDVSDITGLATYSFGEEDVDMHMYRWEGVR